MLVQTGSDDVSAARRYHACVQGKTTGRFPRKAQARPQSWRRRGATQDGFVRIERMYFRLRMTVRGMGLSGLGLSAEFDLSDVHSIRVVLRRPSDDEVAAGHLVRDAQCDASMEVDPNPETVRDVFASLAAGRIPEGAVPRDKWGIDLNFVDDDGRIQPKYTVPLVILPDGFQTFVRQITAELHEAARRAVAVTRWRCADEGLHQPFASRGLEWSFDGSECRSAPTELFVHVSQRRELRIDSSRREEIQVLLDQGADEPLGHALLREAWEQRLENRRSALLIGMTALEVGVKQYFAERVPDATWLLFELQVPPVTRMLSEYLREISDTQLGQDELRVLKDALTLRNRVAHRGEASFGTDKLERSS
jgi:hypothetical protein